MSGRKQGKRFTGVAAGTGEQDIDLSQSPAGQIDRFCIQGGEEKGSAEIYLLFGCQGQGYRSEAVIREIVSTVGRKGKPGEKLIKELIKKKDVYIMQTGGGEYVDELLLGLKQKDLIIATQDKELKKRLKVPVITIRQKKYLILEGN